jgi:hypothetical protein
MRLYLCFLIASPSSRLLQGIDFGPDKSRSDLVETSKALVTFFIVGSFAVMGLYMLLLFVQHRKRD